METEASTTHWVYGFALWEQELAVFLQSTREEPSRLVLQANVAQLAEMSMLPGLPPDLADDILTMAKAIMHQRLSRAVHQAGVVPLA